MKTKGCQICGSTTHTKTFCWQASKKHIRPIRAKTKFNWETAKAQARLANPPDFAGFWYCYLRISTMCLNRLDESTLTWDHVKPKGSHQDLKYDYKNLKPACAPCNTLKGSRSLESVLGEVSLSEDGEGRETQLSA